MDFGLEVEVSGLWTGGGVSGLWTGGGSQWIVNWRWESVDCRRESVDCGLEVGVSELLTGGGSQWVED